ncbi:hypothetical protein HX13_18110 [Chryseobacterium sp. P1-3]|nr:hypothetical protein HX13_18110 [Chryseobacterium sp. P1-3]
MEVAGFERAQLPAQIFNPVSFHFKEFNSFLGFAPIPQLRYTSVFFLMKTIELVFSFPVLKRKRPVLFV